MCGMIVLLKSDLNSDFVQCDILNSASPHQVTISHLLQLTTSFVPFSKADASC